MVAFTNIPNNILSIILIAYFRNALLLFRAKKRRYNNFFMNGYGHAVKKIQHHKQNRRNYGHLILTVKCLKKFGLESGINSAPYSLSGY